MVQESQNTNLVLFVVLFSWMLVGCDIWAEMKKKFEILDFLSHGKGKYEAATYSNMEGWVLGDVSSMNTLSYQWVSYLVVLFRM